MQLWGIHLGIFSALKHQLSRWFETWGKYTEY